MYLRQFSDRLLHHFLFKPSCDLNSFQKWNVQICLNNNSLLRLATANIIAKAIHYNASSNIHLIRTNSTQGKIVRSQDDNSRIKQQTIGVTIYIKQINWIKFCSKVSFRIPLKRTFITELNIVVKLLTPYSDLAHCVLSVPILNQFIFLSQNYPHDSKLQIKLYILTLLLSGA